MLSVICCQSIFGFSFLFSKVGTNISDPFSVLGWRFTVAFIAIAICAVTGLIKIDLKGKDLRPLIMLSIFTPVINYLLETIGISMTTSSESGAMVACLPIACMISASLILRKIPNRTQVLGITVGSSHDGQYTHHHLGLFQQYIHGVVRESERIFERREDVHDAASRMRDIHAASCDKERDHRIAGGILHASVCEQDVPCLGPLPRDRLLACGILP